MSKVIGQDLYSKLLGNAGQSDRLRCNHNLHADYDDPTQRFLNLICQGSYVRPHKHRQKNLWEMFIPLRGSVDLLLFDDMGTISERNTITAGGPDYGIEINANVYHALICTAGNVMLLEIKSGPYSPAEDKIFAEWSVPEGDAYAREYLRWLEHALPGDRFRGNPRCG